MKKTIEKGVDLIGLFPEGMQDVMRTWQNSLYVILSLFALDLKQMGILIFLLFADTFFGTIKALVLYFHTRQKKYKLSGGKFVYGMLKKTIFIAIPFIMSIIAQSLPMIKDSEKIKIWVEAMLVILILQQGYSVIANIASILKKEDVRSKDFVTLFLDKIMLLLERLANYLKDKLDDIFKDNNDSDNSNFIE